MHSPSSAGRGGSASGSSDGPPPGDPHAGGSTPAQRQPDGSQPPAPPAPPARPPQQPNAAASAAKQQAVSRVPYGDKLSAGKQVADAYQEGGAHAAGQELAGAAGATAARAGADALTGGAASAASSAVPKVGELIDKIGSAVGKGVFNGGVKVTAAAASALLIVIVALFGGGTALVSAATAASSRPSAPDDDQCASMPDGWCDVVYDAQRTTHSMSVVVPWEVLAAVARVETDYGRTSPYDTIDRDPSRPTPAYLAANFSTSDTTSASASLGSVPYNSGSLAWGGYENGKIPSSALCTPGWAPGYQLECTAASALTALNEKYKADHNGASLGISDAYRDYAGQVYQRDRWCSKGACSNAATPGTSNHGWALAVDFKDFGSVNSYTDADYAWMKANGEAYGWYHPPYMDEGGKGPHEPWHFEFRGGVTATAAVSAATSQVSAEGSLLAQGWTAATASSNGCEVANPSTAIGGQGTQASGPFLLRPLAASAMVKEGLDPQNPCDAAQYVAGELAQTAREVREDLGTPQSGDQEAAATFWQTVLTQSGLFADPDQSSGECGGVADGTPVDQMVEQIWSCEIGQVSQLHVVSGTSTNTQGVVTFTEYETDTATATLIAEAKTVAWGFSQYGAAACQESAELAGVFPLTAQQAADVGTVERCDAASNIRAAARIVLAGEQVPVADRSSAAGPFAPMLGGWAAMSAALGQDAATFATVGPAASWTASAACTSALDTFVVSLAGDGSIFTDLATATTAPADDDAYRTAAAWPADVATACAGGSDSDLAAVASSLAQAHLTDEAGVAVARPSDSQTAASDEALGDITVDQAQEVAPTAAAATTATTPTFNDGSALTGSVAALTGLSSWFSWQAQAGADAAPATFGQTSLVQRLSSTGNPAQTGPSSDSAATLATVAWQTRVVEWATFYGGLVRPFDTFGTRTGSLLASLSGSATAYASTAGDVQTQVAAVIDAAKKYLGTPYSWAGGGANGPSAGATGLVGFDCSGLTEYAFAQAGYQIGGWTGEQVNAGTAVSSLAQAQPGDLLFFGSPVHHVAIYLGDNQLIHAPKPGDVVKIASVYETPTQIRRVVQARTTATTGDVSTWIASALSVLYANGMPQSGDDVANLTLIITRESSGRPDAVNTTDANARAGHPSFGLMQTIPSTFDANALPGRTDKSNPVDQIIAGARYAVARYGSLANVPGVKSVNAGGAYVGY